MNERVETADESRTPEEVAQRARERRFAEWRAKTETWLEQKSKRTMIIAMLMIMSGILIPFGLILFSIWFGAHGLCAILDILPHLRFSLGGLFLSLVCVQVPVALLVSMPDNIYATATSSALLGTWCYFVMSRLHVAILKGREARKLRDEAR